MASIRDNILQALVARLATLPLWAAQLRNVENAFPTSSKVIAVVTPVGEDKRIETNDQYQATLQVLVLITANHEDADPTTDGGNAYRYLDRLVTLAEKKVHAPDSWGLNPDFTDVQILGHDVEDPSSSNQVTAVLRLQFTYRHDYQDPGA